MLGFFDKYDSQSLISIGNSLRGVGMELSEFPKQVMHVDRYRLARQAARLGLNLQAAQEPVARPLDGQNPELPAAILSWRQALQNSQQVFRRRDQSTPTLSYDPELPISAHRQEIMEFLQTRQTLVVCGETGSGKSTQLPKICLDAGFGRAGMIGHTQPRRLAARAVASRLSEEMGSRIGELVGFKIRFTDSTTSTTLVKVMTDGILLAETQGDRFLEQYDVLIIDEAHERSLNIDFLLGYLKRIQAKRPELKLIITSATIDPQRFADHFSDQNGPAPILEVSGRTYPVEVRYRPIEASIQSDAGGSMDSGIDIDDEGLYKSIAVAVDELWTTGSSSGDFDPAYNDSNRFPSSPHGDILVFLPTERDIRLASKALRGHFVGKRQESDLEILPLYARLSQAEQNRIFSSHRGKRIILATNVAESSLTVPGIRHVIDSGLVRLSRYASRSKVQRLPIEPVSQASADQRSGRCGRLGPGTCIRLYSESDFLGRPKFTTPEIRRSDLANVLLQSYMLKLGPLDDFPLLDIPTPESLRDAHRTLRELGAIDERLRLTELGKQLGRLPCDARVGRMLLEAHERHCLAEVIIIAAGLETSDVRQRPAGQASSADAAHQRFNDPHSDFLGLIRLWDYYENLREKLGRSRLQKALQQNFLSHHGYREWSDVVRQLKDLLLSAGLKIGPRRLELQPVFSSQEVEASKSAPRPPRPEGYAAIHQSLLTGLLSGIAVRDQQGHEYKAAGGLSIRLWPGSGLLRQSPKWIMAAEIVETSKRFGRMVGELDVAWVEHAGDKLLKHTYYDPFWSEKSGAAMVYRKSTLYGLPVVIDRREPLSAVNSSMAREMLIEHGLVDGKWRCSLPFYKHNLEILADMEELARRTRSRKYVVDRYTLMQFFSSRVPDGISDLTSLQSWVTRERGSSQEKALWLQAEDLLDSDPHNVPVESAFPNSLKVAGNEFPLEYHFEPGSEKDGVSITIPQIVLRQLSEDLLGWLVPGLLEEKILAIIRMLPKALRTNFLPAPEVANKLAIELASIDRSLPFSVSLANAMSQHCSSTIRASQLNLQDLPEAFRFRVRVSNDSGEIIGIGRDFTTLATRFGLDSQAVLSELDGTDQQWKNYVLREFSDLDRLPKEFPVVKGGVRISAFTAIVDTGNSAEARLVDTIEEAERLSHGGLVRIFAIKNDRLLRSQVKNLPQLQQSALSLGSLIAKDDLLHALRDLIVRLALMEEQSLPRDSATLEARQMEATKKISIASQEVAAWLPEFAKSFHQLRLLLESVPQSWREVADDIHNLLQDLKPKDFIRTTPWNWLREYPRYLQAARMRLDKLKSAGLQKDRKLAEPLSAARNAYQELRACNTLQFQGKKSAVEELRWALHEFHVSIFAQQLGTKMTVSAKRINELVEGIQRLS